MVRCRNVPELTYQTLQAEAKPNSASADPARWMLTSQAAARRGLLLGAVGCLAPVGLVAERDLAAVGQDIAALTLRCGVRTVWSDVGRGGS